VRVSRSKLSVANLMDFYQAFRETIGWTMRIVKSAMTVKVYSQLGDANITAAFVVSTLICIKDARPLSVFQVKYSALDALLI
jgi:hypothetical protein